MVTESLKEENKHLISMRTSLFATVVILTGGLVGLFLADINFLVKLSIITIGSYIDLILIINTIEANKLIIKNIGVMKNEHLKYS